MSEAKPSKRDLNFDFDPFDPFHGAARFVRERRMGN